VRSISPPSQKGAHHLTDNIGGEKTKAELGDDDSSVWDVNFPMEQSRSQDPTAKKTGEKVTMDFKEKGKGPNLKKEGDPMVRAPPVSERYGPGASPGPWRSKKAAVPMQRLSTEQRETPVKKN